MHSNICRTHQIDPINFLFRKVNLGSQIEINISQIEKLHGENTSRKMRLMWWCEELEAEVLRAGLGRRRHVPVLL